MDPNIQNIGIADKRKLLRQLSDSVTDLVTNGEFETVNDAVIDTFYKDETHHIFKSFNKWREDGYRIIKGSKAFVIWGRPVNKQKSEQAAQEGKEAEPTDNEIRDFFPLAFVFSNAQVERRQND